MECDRDAIDAFLRKFHTEYLKTIPENNQNANPFQDLEAYNYCNFEEYRYDCGLAIRKYEVDFSKQNKPTIFHHCTMDDFRKTFTRYLIRNNLDK